MKTVFGRERATNRQAGFRQPGMQLPPGRGQSGASPAIDAGDEETIVKPADPYDLEGHPVVGIVDRGAYQTP